MSELYPPEAKHLNVLEHLEELRRRLFFVLIVFAVFTVVAFFYGSQIFEWTKKPIQALPGQMIFISPSEAFTAYFQLSLVAGFFLTFPFLLYQSWKFLVPAFAPSFRRRIFFWLLLSFLLFMGGTVFAYWIALPFAFGFLISFGSQMALPQITLGNYVSFFTFLILSGAFVFQIPVVLGLFSELGFISPAVLKSKRPYALIVILVIAAIITPTQDIFNMLLFAVPMMLLYECGILLAAYAQRKGSAR
ncbi:MAG TPA: twin-arginine translocase subunit TatC [Candidatus Omnitrophota bacterium]|nr:twin-arginine translocase subunit TatC [Candidatus Omnitrophota bacterium]